MARRFTSLLVQDRIVSIREMDEALRVQRSRGGRVGTNLLEITSIDDDVMLRYLAKALEVEPAPVDACSRIQKEVAQQLPAPDVQRLQAIPIGRKGEAVDVLVLDPLSDAARSELEGLLGAPVRPLLVLEHRFHVVAFALYDLEVPERYRMLAERFPTYLGFVTKQVPDEPARSVPADSAGRTVPASASLLIGGGGDSGDFEVAPTTRKSTVGGVIARQMVRDSEPTLEPAGATVLPPTQETAPEPAAAKRPQMIALEDVLAVCTKIASTRDRDALFGLTLNFSLQLFLRATLITRISDGRYRVLAARHADRELTLDRSPFAIAGDSGAIGRAFGERAHMITAATDSAVEALYLHAGLEPAREVVLLPVQVRGRTVLLLAGDCGTERVDPVRLTPLFLLLRRLDDALADLIMRRRALNTQQVPVVPDPDSHASTPAASLTEDAESREAADSSPPQDTESAPAALSREEDEESSPAASSREEHGDSAPAAPSQGEHGEAPEASDEGVRDASSSAVAAWTQATEASQAPTESTYVAASAEEADPGAFSAMPAPATTLPGVAGVPDADSSTGAMPAPDAAASSEPEEPAASETPAEPESQPEPLPPLAARLAAESGWGGASPLGGGAAAQATISGPQDTGEQLVAAARGGTSEAEPERVREEVRALRGADPTAPKRPVDTAARPPQSGTSTARPVAQPVRGRQGTQGGTAIPAPDTEELVVGELRERLRREPGPADALLADAETSPTGEPIRELDLSNPDVFEAAHPQRGQSQTPDRPAEVEELDSLLQRLAHEPVSGAARILALRGTMDAELWADTILASFPGHLVLDRRLPIEAEREVHAHGPLLRFLKGRIRPFVRHLLRFSMEGSDDQSWYALRVLMEHVAPSALAPVAEKLVYRRDPALRALAFELLRRARGSEAWDDALRSLRRNAEAGAPHVQDLAIRALGELSDEDSVHLLVLLLASPSTRLRSHVAQALERITLQHFGSDRLRWERWYAQKGHQGREAWLFDAMVHPEEAVRRNAARAIAERDDLQVAYDPAGTTSDHRLALRIAQAQLRGT